MTTKEQIDNLTTEDLEWLANIIENSTLLFYGEFEDYLNSFLKEVFKYEFKDIGFGYIQKDEIFLTAYWFLLSWLCSHGLFEYGSSPRGGWLTEDGKRFKKIILENDNAISLAEDYIHKKHN